MSPPIPPPCSSVPWFLTGHQEVFLIRMFVEPPGVEGALWIYQQPSGTGISQRSLREHPRDPSSTETRRHLGMSESQHMSGQQVVDPPGNFFPFQRFPAGFLFTMFDPDLRHGRSMAHQPA